MDQGVLRGAQVLFRAGANLDLPGKLAGAGLNRRSRISFCLRRSWPSRRRWAMAWPAAMAASVASAAMTAAAHPDVTAGASEAAETRVQPSAGMSRRRIGKSLPSSVIKVRVDSRASVATSGVVAPGSSPK